jgi:two-component system, OmpR family, sensor histidine kinase VicK
MICSNVRELVEHQQYVFDTLWNKSRPSQVRFREIEDGIQANFIETIQNPSQIQEMLWKLTASAREEVLVIFSTHSVSLWL